MPETLAVNAGKANLAVTTDAKPVQEGTDVSIIKGGDESGTLYAVLSTGSEKDKKVETLIYRIDLSKESLDPNIQGTKWEKKEGESGATSSQVTGIQNEELRKQLQELIAKEKKAREEQEKAKPEGEEKTPDLSKEVTPDGEVTEKEKTAAKSFANDQKAIDALNKELPAQGQLAVKDGALAIPMGKSTVSISQSTGDITVKDAQGKDVSTDVTAMTQAQVKIAELMKKSYDSQASSPTPSPTPTPSPSPSPKPTAEQLPPSSMITADGKITGDEQVAVMTWMKSQKLMEYLRKQYGTNLTEDESSIKIAVPDQGATIKVTKATGKVQLFLGENEVTSNKEGMTKVETKLKSVISEFEKTQA